MLPNPWLITAESKICKQHWCRTSIYSSDVHFLGTGTLSWLEEKYQNQYEQSYQDAAVDSPIAEMESSYHWHRDSLSDQLSAPEDTALIWDLWSSVPQSPAAVIICHPVVLLIIWFCVNKYALYSSHLLCLQIKDNVFRWRKTLKLIWQWIKSIARRGFLLWRALTLNDCTTSLLFTSITKTTRIIELKCMEPMHHVSNHCDTCSVYQALMTGDPKEKWLLKTHEIWTPVLYFYIE